MLLKLPALLGCYHKELLKKCIMETCYGLKRDKKKDYRKIDIIAGIRVMY